jgi:hypothetical protein
MPGQFIICEGCILNTFVKKTKTRWQEICQVLYTRTNYVEGDVVAQANMENELMETSGVARDYELFLDGAEDEAMGMGGLLSKYINPSQYVDEMANNLRGAELEGLEDTMLDLFAGLGLKESKMERLEMKEVGEKWKIRITRAPEGEEMAEA